MKFITSLTAITMGLAFFGIYFFGNSNANADKSPTLLTPEIHIIDYPYDLPKFNGDLDEVKFEVYPGSMYSMDGSMNMGSGPYSVYLDWDLTLTISAFGGVIFPLYEWEGHQSHSGEGPEQVILSEDTLVAPNTTPVTLTSDARCNLFEGTGDVGLTWTSFTNHSFGINYGNNIGPTTMGLDAPNLKIKVTYTPK